MLLKWLFTALAILWLIQALRPYFAVQQGSGQTPPPQTPSDKNRFKNDDDYIDYEEIK